MTPSPPSWLRRVLGDEDRESDRPALSSSRAERARADARRWLEMREAEYDRRLRERREAREYAGR